MSNPSYYKITVYLGSHFSLFCLFTSLLTPHFQGANGKRKEVEGGGGDQSGLVKKRTDTVSYALLAEVNSFHEQRVRDIKSSHQQFLQEQIKFYQKVCTKDIRNQPVILLCPFRSQRSSKRL